MQALRDSWPGAFTGQRPALDMRRQAAIVADGLIADDHEALEQLFEDIDTEPPAVVWSPSAEQLADEILIFLRNYWLDLRRGDAPPLSRHIDALDLAPALGYLMLLEPQDGDTDFLYRVYGSRIADYSRFEMTGKRVWDVPSTWVAAYFSATYRAVCIRHEPLFSFHRARIDQFHAQWQRLILPFVNEEGVVDRLLVGNVPSVKR